MKIDTDNAMNILLIEAVVEGYHEFPFTIMTGESFVN